MMRSPFLYFFIFLIGFQSAGIAQQSPVIPAANRLNQYVPELKGKRVGLVMNQTSVVGNTFLLDTLIRKNINIVAIFAPEHGFRGVADAGAKVNDELDANTGIPVISLYGKNKKPTREQLANIDVLIYDIQDVGARFYTYISTLQYVMEACAEYKKYLVILDRPNPNGHYVDGPVLEKEYRSFVGMQPVPVVYGMTVGEYAQMLVGENWFPNAKALVYKVIRCEHYDHKTKYKLPVAPSPNLQSSNSIKWYPSLCFFEGTVISVGRGTDAPFEQWGHPGFAGRSDYYFIPKSKTGAQKPMYMGKKCYGEHLKATDGREKELNKLDLEPLLTAYSWYSDKEKFFNDFFNTLAGNFTLKQMIIEGNSEAEIRASWKKDLDAFKLIRKKYLLYKDFD